MNTNNNYRQLGYAIAIQALRDYFNAPTKKRQIILRELKSTWMDFITNGLSVILAEKLEKNPKEVYRNFKKIEEEEEELIC